MRAFHYEDTSEVIVSNDARDIVALPDTFQSAMEGVSNECSNAVLLLLPVVAEQQCRYDVPMCDSIFR